VRFVLADQVLVRQRGWHEFAISTLYTPRRLFYDGCATYASELVVAGKGELSMYTDFLFHLSGLDPSLAAEYQRVRTVTRDLWVASVAAGRRYIQNMLTSDEAIRWLERFALVSPQLARMHIAFYDTYRSSYVQYVLGRNIIRGHVEVTDSDSLNERWTRFSELYLKPGLSYPLAGCENSIQRLTGTRASWPLT
jgi:hypothetical protein